MLLSDGNPADAAVLRSYEEQILDIAAMQGLDLQTKLNVAAEQIEDEMEPWLLVREGFRMGGKPCASRIVVTPALRRWHAMQTLESFYRDAYYQDLNDRFKGKWRMYAELKSDARRTFLARGVEMVARPIPVGPEALVGTGSGSFGGSDALFRLTWVDTRGAEGTPGPAAALEMPQGTRAMVHIGPTEAERLRWNVYAGVSADDLHLQNSEPLRQGDVWAQTVALIIDSRKPGEGQPTDYVVADDRRLVRG